MVQSSKTILFISFKSVFKLVIVELVLSPLKVDFLATKLTPEELPAIITLPKFDSSIRISEPVLLSTVKVRLRKFEISGNPTILVFLSVRSIEPPYVPATKVAPSLKTRVSGLFKDGVPDQV